MMELTSALSWLALGAVVLGAHSAEADDWTRRIFPEDVRTKLDAGASYEVIVIVRGDRETDFESFLADNSRPLRSQPLEKAWIPILQGYAVRTGGASMKRLAGRPEVEALWIVPEPLVGSYVPILRGIVYALQNLPPGSGANVSLGPPRTGNSLRFDLREPIHRLTRAGASRGITFVFSAGNDGPGNDTLNPWGLADWTLSVGAASADGKELWDRSSRGIPGDARYHPTLVAPGVDRETTELSRPGEEDSSPRVQATGTSIAAAEVSRCVAQVLFFLRAEVARRSELEAVMELEMKYPADKVLPPRLLGSVREVEDGTVVTYPLASPDPRLVKQILMDLAEPMPGYERHQVGAGFISYPIVLHHLGQHGEAGAQIMPIKAVEQ